MRVLLLSGGTSNEREISLRSSRSAAQAIRELGHECIMADPADHGFDLSSYKNSIDVVFPLLHGAGGEDGTIQRQLENLDMPFVGSDSESSALCFDKWAYKQQLLAHNMPASRGIKITSDDLSHTDFSKPFVLKPFDGGSSLDTLIARHPDEAEKNQAIELLKKYPVMLLEPLVEGTEITVGILGQEPLPIVEIQVPDGLEFDYENKYNGRIREFCPPETVSTDIQARAQELALKIHNLCGCRHLSRTDMIIDVNGNLHVLETNTIPGFTDASLFPLMAKQAGYSMPQLVDKLLRFAVHDTRVDQRE